MNVALLTGDCCLDAQSVLTPCFMLCCTVSRAQMICVVCEV